MKNKLVIIAFLLLSTLTFSQTVSRTKHPTATSWGGSITNVTDSIALNTLFTPPSTGQYRTSITVVLHRDALSDAQWSTVLNWLDGAGFENATVSTIASSAATPNASTSDVRTFTTALQTPIHYSVTKTDTDKSFIDIFWTVELLVPEQL